MGTQAQPIQLLDYYQQDASDRIVPQPAALRSQGWKDLHLELHQQPPFATEEHCHTMHVLACGVVSSLGLNAPGVRSLDGQRMRERRSAGDIAIIPAGIAHHCSWDTPAQFMVLAIAPTLLQQVGQDWVNPDQIELIPRFMNESDGLLQSLFSTLKTEAAIGGMGSSLLVDSLKTTLAIHLLRHYCTTRPRLSSYTQGLSQTQLGFIVDYINDHLHQNLKLNDLAAIVQLSPYHFLRLFKQSTGVTPHQYILRSRIDRAKSLLQHSQLTIADIASRTGFCDQSHLTRQFKQLTGMTPKQFLQS